MVTSWEMPPLQTENIMRTRVLGLVLFLGSVSLAAAAPRAVPEFPGVASVPLPPGLNFGGFFKHHQPVKVVFGISDPGPQLKESLINAALMIQYLKAHGYHYRMQMVLYGKAVFAVDQWKMQYSGYKDLMEKLHAEGVEFRVCYNSLHQLHVSRSDVYPYVKVIPAGLLQIVKKQMQGYSYISNH